MRLRNGRLDRDALWAGTADEETVAGVMRVKVACAGRGIDFDHGIVICGLAK